MKTLILLSTLLFAICVTAFSILFFSGCGEASNTHDITSSAPDDTYYPADEQYQSEWCYGGLEINPEKPVVGHPVNIGAWLHVPGIVERPGTAFLVIDGEVGLTKNIFIDADCTDWVEFIYTFNKPGVYEIRFCIMLGGASVYQSNAGDLISIVQIAG
ncbi:MAG: hypothetical protein JW954_06335 [Dehalococcoidaceae bacterium]|nr:hypothetical protein [Dehalococcoidaceae bacterium]